MQPITMVPNAGVMYLGWTLAKRLGSASYTAIDSVPRAVGRMVVWVDDSADTDTVSSSSDARIGPPTGPPSTVSTSSVLLGLFRPIPTTLKPENDCTA